MNSTYSVITADLVDSSQYSKQHRLLVNKEIRKIIKHLGKRGEGQYTIFRGDSIQGILTKPEIGLRHALYLKAGVNAIKFESRQRSPRCDVRISVGVGQIDYLAKNIHESDGEAFRLSGRTLDSMKSSGTTLALSASKESFMYNWRVIFGLIDTIMDKWSIASAEMMLMLLFAQTDHTQIHK